MSTSKKIILRVVKGNPKLGYLKLQTITNRKSKEKSLKIQVQVKNWNADKQFVYSPEPNADKINQIIQEALREEKGEVIKKIDENSLIDFAEKIIPLIPIKNTRDTKMYSFNKLKEFIGLEGKTELLFTEVDLFFIKRYYNYLKENCESSTANEYMTNFKYFINQADFHDHYTYKKDPFKKFKKTRSPKKHEVMSPSEVDTFFEYEPEDESFFHVQCGFGFMMYAGGMRVSDLLSLKWGDFRKSNGLYIIEFNMQKTKQIMTSKVFLETLQFLIPFIEQYDKCSLKGYRTIEKKIAPLHKAMNEMVIEESEIVVQPLDNMKLGMMERKGSESINDELLDLIQVVYNNHYRKLYLNQQIENKKEEIAANKLLMIESIGKEILKLKNKYPEDTVLPHCRRISEKDIDKVKHRVTTSFNYRLEVIREKTGIKTKIHNHQARHVFAQRLFENGANFHKISIALGHKTLETTENYRSKLVSDEDDNVLEEFSKIRPLNWRVNRYKS